MKKSILDKTIEFFSPSAAADRYHAKSKIAYLDKVNGYPNPSTKGRFMRGVDVNANSPDADTLRKRMGSVALSRNAYFKYPLAVAIIKRIKTNTVGTGLKLQPQIDYDYLGLDEEQSRNWTQDVQRKFKLHAESKDVDLTRQQNFYELQELAFLTVLLSGDGFATFPIKPLKSLVSPVRIRLIEGDLCSTPQDENDSGFMHDNIQGGVKIDKDGAPISYFFKKFYSGRNINNAKAYTKDDWKEVKAFDKSGMRQVFHLFFRERPGQSRGMPLLAPLIDSLTKVITLKESELTAHVVSSFFTVFVKDQSGFANPLQAGFNIDKDTSNKEANIQSDDGSMYNGLMQGGVVYLDDDKDIAIADPRQMSKEFEGFYMSFIKELAAATETPYEQLMLHFQASYSASRGALLEGWKAVRARRNWLAINFCQPFYQAWLDYAVASGDIIAPGYFENKYTRAAWSKTVWSGMGNGQLDPLKETKAAVMRINNNLSNHAKEYNTIHDDADWEGNVQTRSNEEKLIDELDLSPDETTNTLTMVEEEDVDTQGTEK